MAGFNLVTAVAALAVALAISGTVAQVKLDFCGSTEVPSLKCALNPGRFDVSIENRTVCFCVLIQGTVPTYNCMKADGRATIDDIRELVATIRNITSMFPIPTMSTTSLGTTLSGAGSSTRPTGNVGNGASANANNPGPEQTAAA